MIERRPVTALYNETAVRRLDATTIDTAGIPGLELMTRAGHAVCRALSHRFPGTQCVVVVCGVGNNAGDGYVVARAAARLGHAVRVVQLGNPENLGADARTCYERLLADGIETESELDALELADVVVDGLFGIGLSRPVEGEYAAVVERINALAAPVISIDSPSGIDANTGVRMGTAVSASLTVTFIGRKPGLYTGDGPAHCGEILFDDLGVPPSVYEQVPPSANLLQARDLEGRFTPRPRTAHKGSHGHVLVVGGAPGFSGAIRLAGEAAARTGAGLVSVATHPDTAAGANALRPELMVHAVGRTGELGPLVKRASVIAIGPGLGQSAWASALLGSVLDGSCPLVVDADALNLLSREPVRSDRWILTPHPGEAARLLGVSTGDINADRLSAAAAIHEKFGGVVVLKGAGTVIADGGVPTVIGAGNPGMASGGMGDVLTGVIAGFVAQGESLADAASFGAGVHAVAADRAAEGGERGLLAGDLMVHLRALVN